MIQFNISSRATADDELAVKLFDIINIKILMVMLTSDQFIRMSNSQETKKHRQFLGLPHMI